PPPAFTAADLDGLPATPVESLNSDTDLAHILFTSGSTGLPKGVMITHRSVLRFLEWAWKYFGISQSDRASQHSPLHFDLSTFDIFSTLGAGAELHLTPSGVNLLPHKMGQYIRKARLTQWFSDRKSTCLNSSHVAISYAVFCLKKKKSQIQTTI